jgi:mono/diheme cytochrome c family protein
MKKIIVILSTFAVACVQNSYESSIQDGFELYVAYCGDCHSSSNSVYAPSLDSLSNLKEAKVDFLVNKIRKDSFHNVFFDSGQIDTKVKICNLVKYITTKKNGEIVETNSGNIR